MTDTIRLSTAVLAALAASLVLGSAARADTGVGSSCTPAPPPLDPALPTAPLAVVGYPTPSSTSVTRTTATLLASIDTGGAEGQVAFELDDATVGVRCTAVQRLAAVSGPQPVSAPVVGQKPGTTVRFRVVVTTAAGQVVGADQTFTTVAPVARLAAGTTILGVRVGHLTPAQAQARVKARFARPLVFTWRGKRWSATPKQLGATADVGGAVERALAGSGGGRSIAVTVEVDPAKVARYVAYLDRLFSRPARVGSVERAGRKAVLVKPQTGRTVQKARTEAAIVRTLKAAKRRPIELQVSVNEPGARDGSRS